MHAYFDCFSGISGDMTLGALVDLGVPIDWLREQLGHIPLTGFQIRVEPAVRHGISAKKIHVDVPTDDSARTWLDIRTLIDASPFDPKVKRLSQLMFKRLAVAEAGIHNSTPENVHFHEVGGVDAMVDIIGTALCINYLDIDTVTASPIALGRGRVKCQHGTLPVPSPATVAILKGIPVQGTRVEHELTTPTGAAIVATLAARFDVIPEINLKKCGYGAGDRDHAALPNVLRVLLGDDRQGRQGEAVAGIQYERVAILETVIDDMNPELFGYVMERLYDDGALDVCWIPTYMKKNRPGTLIQVVCPRNKKQTMIECLLSETTSLGVRFYTLERATLFRETVEIASAYGPVRVKRIVSAAGEVRLVPEYEACRKIALEHHLPIREVYESLLKEIRDPK